MSHTSAAHDISASHENDTRTALLLDCTVRIVTAFVSHAHVPASDVPGLIRAVGDAIGGCIASRETGPADLARIPAVPVSRSVTDDWIICLEDGERFRSLRRHLTSKYGLTPQDYRERWGLPDDYPMVAPAYARQRSQLARKFGLGRPRARIRDDGKS